MSAVLPDPFEVPPATTDWRRRILIAVGVFAVVAVVGGVVLSRAAGSSTARYRTALVANHDVESVLTGVGSIEPVSQATVAFPIKGTVASVDVAVGDTVATGQTLATIDTTDLTSALHDKQAALASAQLSLSKALTGTTSTSTSSSASSSSASSGSGASTASAPSSSGPTRTSGEVAAAQQTVVSDQHAVDAALAVANQALATSVQVCSAATATTPTTTAPTTATTPTTTAPTPPTTTAPTDPVSACQTALQAVHDAQVAVASAQSALAASSSALDALLGQQAANQSSSAASSGSARTATGSTGASGSGSAAQAGSGSTASSSDLVARQKAVDAAAADVAVAEQDLAQATIVSPIAGTVAVVDLAVGSAVTAASTTAHVVVVGAGGLEVSTMVSVDHIPDVKVGQSATVLPDGASDPLSGRVVAIGLTPTTATTGTTYQVTIGLDDRGTGLGNGATGSVSIVTAGVTSVLSVPTSAVRTDGTTHTVRVVDGANVTNVTVQVGVVGSTYTQITDGLTAGQSVVLADLDQALPGSATSSSNGTRSTNRNPGSFTGFNGGGPPPGFTPGGR